MVKSYLIGVDIGTAGTKAAIFDTEGRLVADAYEESMLRYPRPGWVEQDQEDFYRSAVNTIKEAVAKSSINPKDVAAIAFDSQMSGIGGIDREWNPVIRYDSWLDTRCEPYIEFMRKKAGNLVLEKTGCAPTYAHGPKILWWKEEHKEIFKRIYKFIVPACYVAGKMTGLRGDEAFIDYTYIHFSGFSDTEKMSWSEELCDIFKVPSSKLPRIVQPWDIVGKLTSKAAKDCGLIEGIPVAAGAGDTTAGFLGASLVDIGRVVDVAGTASCFASCVDRYIPDVKNKTFLCSRAVVPNLWYPLAFINGGGLCLRWFRDEFAKEEKLKANKEGTGAYSILNEEASKVPPGSDSLLFIPHLGGRVCPNNPNLRGVWFGFTWGHTKAHFYRAILEGIAYEYLYYFKILQDLFPGISFKEAIVIGGGARSDLWNQIKADVLGLSYNKINREELAVLGAAIIAGYSVGIFDDLASTSRKFVRNVSRINPRSKYHKHYENYAKIYLDLIETQDKLFNELVKISKT
ncbi:MAG: FGGY-family carbohydrate kinase [bacterium]